MEPTRMASDLWLALSSYGTADGLEEAPAAAFAALESLRIEYPDLRIAVRRLPDKVTRIIIAVAGFEGFFVGAWGSNRGIVEVNLPQLFIDVRAARRKTLRNEIETRWSQGLAFVLPCGLLTMIFLLLRDSSAKTLAHWISQQLFRFGEFTPLLYVFGTWFLVVSALKLVGWLRLRRLWHTDTAGRALERLTDRYPVLS